MNARGTNASRPCVWAGVAKLALLVPLVAGACTHARAVSSFDDHLRNQRWTDAAAAFERDSSLHHDVNALERAAALYATPNRATWDPDRAAALYDEARELADDHRLSPDAARISALVSEVIRARAERRARERELLDALARADSATHTVRLERERLLAIVAVNDEERALLVRLVARLESDLRERESQMGALRSELNRLKAIDLSPRQRTSSDSTTPPLRR